MKLQDIRLLIQERRSEGIPYKQIASSMGISTGMVYRIEHGHTPGPEISRILQLDPPSRLQRIRARRDSLNSIAQAAGFPSWCAYETYIIHLGGLPNATTYRSESPSPLGENPCS